MKVYTAFSESHKVFYDNYFLPTLPKDLTLIKVDLPQTCKSGVYFSKGWAEFCYKKTELFLKACEENKNEYFVFSDVDIQFFNEELADTLIKEIEDYDLACQYDGRGLYCSGFFVCKSNKKTINMFNTINKKYIHDDQKSLNKYINLCNAKFLSSRFYTVGQTINEPWTNQTFLIPKDILVHHANWTVGIDNKIKLLEKVKEQFTKNV